jgi:hypothetical protein
MSRRPAQEPILGDKRTCDALDLIIVPRLRIWVAVFPCTARCRTLRSPRCPQGSPQINCVSQVLFAIGGERHISDRIAPAVRAIEQADVAFQLFYDDDPSANGNGLQAVLRQCRSIVFKRLVVPVGAVTDALSSSR